jgi:hypothetical protein
MGTTSSDSALIQFWLHQWVLTYPKIELSWGPYMHESDFANDRDHAMLKFDIEWVDYQNV